MESGKNTSRKLLKDNNVSDHQNSLEREIKEEAEGEEGEDEEEELAEEDNEGGEDDELEDIEDEKDLEIEDFDQNNTKTKSNTSIKMSLSVRAKVQPDEPESPLPVILINNTNGKVDQERTDEETNKSKDYLIVDEISKKEKVKKNFQKVGFVNLRARYDGFNRLRFIYPRIIPRLVEEKDLVLP